MSSIKNEYVLILNKHLANRTYEVRSRLIDKIIEDIEQTGLLNSPEFEDDDWDLNTPIGLQETENEEADQFAQSEKIASFSSDERVARKRQELIEAGIIKKKKVKKKVVKPLSVTRFGRNALHEAVVANDLETVKRLLRNGIAQNQKDNNGNTPMDLALLEENFEAVKILKGF